MKVFSELITKLDQTTKTNEKIEALTAYFDEADAVDKLWCMAILSHRRPKRTVNTTLLRTWAAAYSGIPLWLFEESYHIVGDLAETIALLLPDPQNKEQQTLTYWINYIRSLGALSENEKQEQIILAWNSLDKTSRFIFNKLITGGFRIGVSQKLMVKALAKHTQSDENILAHRLMGNWSPDDVTFEQFILEERKNDDLSLPYPFYLAYALEEEVATLGHPADWSAEWKWDGIRGQMIFREGQHFLWSRGEELITDKFPEFQPLATLLPNGTVLDGEILPYKDGKPLSFQVLQTRIGRKNVTKKVLEEAPAVMMVYDLLEYKGKDIRSLSWQNRRTLLTELLEEYPAFGQLILSETIAFESWEALSSLREDARENHSEGLMLKLKASDYKTGRRRGEWWKWKIDPLTIDAVMIYAQSGHGRRANLYTDFTFAVWDGDQLVPFTKAYSGLTDKEFIELTSWVRANTIERFGPVRSVMPYHVFEIAFEGIAESKRHKSGIALRFPRMKRWRKDKAAKEANTLMDLQALLKSQS